MDYTELNREMRRKHCKDTLVRTDKILTLLVFLSYPVLLMYTAYAYDEAFFSYVMIPFAGLVLVSVMRIVINRQRPFEKYGYRPILKKNSRGRSFPSRHVFSAAVIACAWLFMYAPAGIFLMAAAVCIAAVRVLGGVHYISDVCAGLALGISAGLFLAAV
ncbi:MAG: phosphatase PAP2 family protein [Solobacterium sp.]|nr:phosphatase PAP2 family protein [Solobacterium sp.]